MEQNFTDAQARLIAFADTLGCPRYRGAFTTSVRFESAAITVAGWRLKHVELAHDGRGTDIRFHRGNDALFIAENSAWLYKPGTASSVGLSYRPQKPFTHHTQEGFFARVGTTEEPFPLPKGISQNQLSDVCRYVGEKRGPQAGALFRELCEASASVLAEVRKSNRPPFSELPEVTQGLERLLAHVGAVPEPPQLSGQPAAVVPQSSIQRRTP